MKVFQQVLYGSSKQLISLRARERLLTIAYLKGLR